MLQPAADNVIEFRPPRRRPAPPPKLTFAEARQIGRPEWESTLKAYWADKANWKVVRRVDEIAINIGKKTVKATIEPKDGFWIWRLRFEDMQIESPWIYVDKESAFANALDAVLAVV